MSKEPTVPQATQIKLRVHEPLRSLIEEAANEHGISVNAEISNRLRKTFDDERRVDNVLQTREGIGIAKLLAALICEIGKISGFEASRTVEGSLNWFNNPWAFDRAVRATKVALDALRPEGEIEEPAHYLLGADAAAKAHTEEWFAQEILKELMTGDLRYGDDGNRVETLRNELGDLYPRLCERIERYKQPVMRVSRKEVLRARKGTKK